MTTTNEMATVKAVKFNGYKIELSTNIKGKPVARLYKLLTAGKNKGQYKLIQGYYFMTDISRELWVKEQVARINNRIEDRIKTNAAKKEAVAGHTFKVGDCLYQSWGYDQTNIDFFEVVEVLPKSVKIRRIGEKMVKGSEGFMCENVVPDMGNYAGDAVIRPVKVWLREGTAPTYTVSNGRHSLNLYTYGERGVYQSHYA